LHAFWNPPASTGRLISPECDPFAPLWPGSTTITFPLRSPVGAAVVGAVVGGVGAGAAVVEVVVGSDVVEVVVGATVEAGTADDVVVERDAVRGDSSLEHPATPAAMATATARARATTGT
jgi:hypothetical protein